MKNLVGRNYYHSRGRFAKTRGAIWTYSVSSKAVLPSQLKYIKFISKKMTVLTKVKLFLSTNFFSLAAN